MKIDVYVIPHLQQCHAQLPFLYTWDSEGSSGMHLEHEIHYKNKL